MELGAVAGWARSVPPWVHTSWFLSLLFVLDLPLNILFEEQVDKNSLKVTTLVPNPLTSCFHV